MVPRSNFATIKANQKTIDHKVKSALNAIKKPVLKIEKPSADFSDPYKNPYFDPNLAGGSSAPKPKFSRTLKIAPQGKYIEQANQLRAEEHLEKLKQQIAANVKKAGMEAEMELVDDSSLRREPPPEVEWWDQLIVDGNYDNPVDYERVSPDGETLITNLIQHPIPIQPPEAASQAPKDLMLTEKERKKLRRQRRMEAHKEKQDKIKLGILPPEKPKVKIANLYKVLGTEAVLDPTQIEVRVRKEMAAREQAHLEHNESKKLTDEQRKEKKRLKLLEDTSESVFVAVFRYAMKYFPNFRVKNLDHNHFKFKVDKNAQQHNLTGTAILYPAFNLVIVEGGPKGIKFYKNLMLNRIQWKQFDQGEEVNECVLVWEGEIKQPAFKGFRFKTIPTELMVKEFLEKHDAVAYWNAAKNFVAGGF
jgi:U4/U6 small nuclear ribonucleoprotein PRP3